MTKKIKNEGTEDSKCKEVIQKLYSNLKLNKNQENLLQVLREYINYAIGRTDHYENVKNSLRQINISIIIALTTVILFIINLLNNSLLNLKFETFVFFIIGSIFLIAVSFVLVCLSFIEMRTKIKEDDLFFTLGHYKENVQKDNKFQEDYKRLYNLTNKILSNKPEDFIKDYIIQLFIIYRHQAHYHRLARIFDRIMLILDFQR